MKNSKHVYNDVSNDLANVYNIVDGNEVYRKDSQGNEIYTFGNDGKVIFAKRYDVAPGKHKLQPYHYYAKDKMKNEFYPRGIDRDVVIYNLINGEVVPVYAVDNGKIPFYPRDKSLNDFIPLNGTYITLPNGEILYPTKSDGMPIYPNNAQGDFFYVDGKHIAKDRRGKYVYTYDSFGNEFYPPLGNFATEDETGNPIYAQTAKKHVLFPKDDEGNEFYLKDKFGNDHIFNREKVEIDRYARLKNDDEIYPRRIVKCKPFFYNDIISRRRYAKKANNTPFYPLDCFGNEFAMIAFDETMYQYCYPIGYPITNDNFYIVPEKDDNEGVQLPYLRIDESHYKFHLYRGDMGYRDFLTDIKCTDRKSLAPIKIKYSGGKLHTRPKSISTKQSFVSDIFNKLFYVFLALSILVISIFLFWKNKRVNEEK